jgi:outer membrane protein OmpA-like peptidoglycan-associated protein
MSARGSDWEPKHPGHFKHVPKVHSTGKTRSIHMAKVDRTIALAKPESKEVLPVTGRYEDQQGNWALLVNQAGPHFEAWLSPAMTDERRKTHHHRRCCNLFGEHVAGEQAGLFHVSLADRPGEPVGTITEHKLQLNVDLTLDGEKVHFAAAANSYRPTVSMPLLMGIDERYRAVEIRRELYPLVHWQLELLDGLIGVRKLGPLLDQFCAVGVAAKHANREERLRLAEQMSRAFDEALSSTHWHPEDLPLVREELRAIVAVSRHTVKGRARTLYSWLQDVLAIVSSQSPNAMRTLREGMAETLRMPAAPSGKMKDDGLISMIGREAYERLAEPIRDYHYRYEISFSQLNPMALVELLKKAITGKGMKWPKLPLGFPLSPQAGTVTISRKVAPDWRVEESWNLLMVISQVSFSKSVGQQIEAENSGVAYSDLEYSKEDFVGPIWMASLTARGGLTGVGRYGGPGVIWTEGAGLKPVLTFDLSSWINLSVEYGLGVDLSGAWGYLWPSPWQPDKPKKQLEVPEPSVRSNDIGASSVHSEEVYFRRSGDAQLTGDARQLIRVACARYLAALANPGTHLWSIGYADRPDSPDRNKFLSEARAKNTVQAMKDALDDAFALPDDNVLPVGFGETAAKASGDRPHQHNLKWRKVEVILDTQLILTLGGAL